MTGSRQARSIAAVVVGTVGLALSACSSARTTAQTVAPANDVIIGYAAAPGTGVTDSVLSHSGNDPRQQQFETIEQMLIRLPGVEVLRRGADISVYVRTVNSIYGRSEPLCVVDGVPLAGRGIMQAINLIPPGQIKRVDVLRDAAATSVYGPQGANGVIVITTKMR